MEEGKDQTLSSSCFYYDAACVCSLYINVVCLFFYLQDLLKVYKETRNGMLGPDYSTKFSPWLALDVSLLGLSMKRSDHSNFYPGPNMRFRGSKTFYVNLN